MLHVIDRCLNLGATYADVRVIDEKHEKIEAKNESIESVLFKETMGFGVRVIVNGAWGFSSSYKVTSEEADRVVEEAIKIAKSSSIARKSRIGLTDEKAYKASYQTKLKKSPFDVDLKEKTDILLEATKVALKQSDRIKIAKSFYSATNTKKYFANS